MADHEKSERSRHKRAYDHRLRRMRDQSMQPEIAGVREGEAVNFVMECGWGRLIFANTFTDNTTLARTICAERPTRRDIAFYVRDPHVLLAAAPQELFLDPSHSYRLNLTTYRAAKDRRKGFVVRRLASQYDAEAVNILYASRGMVNVPPDFFWSQRDPRELTVLVAEEEDTGAIIGTVMGIDHRRAFGDKAYGTSLWCLAVAPQALHPGIGEALVRRLAEQYKGRGAAYLDLSVLHDNEGAIRLYEKLGFERVPIFTVKHKNSINEALFAGPPVDETLNPYASIIVKEARRRGIHTELIDAPGGFFRLTYGGRSVDCRESLSDFTSGVAVSICDDKSVTRRIVKRAGLQVPEQIVAGDPGQLASFLERHGSVVVKPSRGEQGRGIAVGLTRLEEVETAIRVARQFSNEVLVEQYVEGEDLRLIVIDYTVVATAIRRPARVAGDGSSTIRDLIANQSRRRAAATGGESRIPVDQETERCLALAGYGLDDVLGPGIEVNVRKTANLHTGGTIHDVTSETHADLINAAVAAARAIEIPVTGIDLMVRNPRLPDYWFIEANERPGLANHEPQPTAEKFIDFLFPLSVPQGNRLHNQPEVS